MNPQSIALVGFGAIGRSVLTRASVLPGVAIAHVVVRAERLEETRAALSALGSAARAVDRVPDATTLVLECAGHAALDAHVVPALARGIECAVLSIGALSEPGMPEKLEAAARTGGARLNLLAGAIGGIDAIAAAKLGGLESVVYTGRKPPQGWRGSPAEKVVDLGTLTSAAVIFEGSAREAAHLYPKNANVAATLALAGLGLDATRVRLVADPAVTENIHEYEAAGAFGRMKLEMRGKPLADNPRTSALTVLSALRFLANHTGHVAV
jgi:aspartate dehydrogenase